MVDKYRTGSDRDCVKTGIQQIVFGLNGALVGLGRSLRRGKLGKPTP